MVWSKVTVKSSLKGKIIYIYILKLFCHFIIIGLWFRYDGVSTMVPDQFSHILEEIHKLETELGHLPQKWKVLWDKLELPNTDSLAVSNKYLIYLFIKNKNR